MFKSRIQVKFKNTNRQGECQGLSLFRWLQKQHLVLLWRPGYDTVRLHYFTKNQKKYGGFDFSESYGADAALFDATAGQLDAPSLGDIGAVEEGARLDRAYEEDGNAFLQAEQPSSTESRDEHDDSTCEKEQALIMAIIKKKYWEIEQQYSSFSLYGKQVINQGNRSIAIQCGGIYNAPLNIRYLDSKLSELAENERVALERSKVIIKVMALRRRV